MRLVIAIVGIIWVGSAEAQSWQYDNPDGGGQVHITVEDQVPVMDSRPGPNWNLLIESADHVPSLTTHLYKEECEKLSSALFNRILPSFSECFETPK